MMKRKKICITLPIDVLKEMEETKKRLQIPISLQIELKLRGYTIHEIKK